MLSGMEPETIEVEVLFFARARELAGRASARVRLPAGSSVESAVRRIGEEFPGLGPYLGACRVALDEAFASGREEVRERSVLAVIPPVSGG
jgi:molybdopterin converting factor subunit 1